MNTMNLTTSFASLAITFLIVGAYATFMKSKKIADFFFISSFVLAFCCAGLLTVNQFKKEVIVKIIKLEDGYHLLCDDYKTLRKIAQVLPDASEDELKEMDINSLNLQMVVDWKVNKIAVEMEKKYGNVIAPKVHDGYRELKEISRAEIERVIREHLFKCNEIEKHYHFSSDQRMMREVELIVSEKQKMINKVLFYTFVGFFSIPCIIFMVLYIRYQIFLRAMVALRQSVVNKAAEVFGQVKGGDWFNDKCEFFIKIIEDRVIEPSKYVAFHVLRQRDVSMIPFEIKNDFPNDHFSVEKFYERLWRLLDDPKTKTVSDLIDEVKNEKEPV